MFFFFICLLVSFFLWLEMTKLPRLTIYFAVVHTYFMYFSNARRMTTTTISSGAVLWVNICIVKCDVEGFCLLCLICWGRGTRGGGLELQAGNKFVSALFFFGSVGALVGKVGGGGGRR